MSDRQMHEQDVMELAEELHFEVKKHGSRFSLRRELPDEEPVRRDDMTLEEVEQLLNRWKLHGLGGG